jgi:hypothetical protein
LLTDLRERRIRLVTDAVRKLLAKALELDQADRALVAAELIASLDGPADQDAEVAWATEISRRVTEIESGSVELVDWSDVRAQIERDILRR